jgi:hypothetical protein
LPSVIGGPGGWMFELPFPEPARAAVDSSREQTGEAPMTN